MGRGDIHQPTVIVHVLAGGSMVPFALLVLGRETILPAFLSSGLL
jgi:hypothetical protein